MLYPNFLQLGDFEESVVRSFRWWLVYCMGQSVSSDLGCRGLQISCLLLQRWRRNEFPLSEDVIRHLMCYRSARASSSHGLVMRIQECEKKSSEFACLPIKSTCLIIRWSINKFTATFKLPSTCKWSSNGQDQVTSDSNNNWKSVWLVKKWTQIHWQLKEHDHIYNMDHEYVHSLLSTKAIADVANTVTEGKIFC